MSRREKIDVMAAKMGDQLQIILGTAEACHEHTDYIQLNKDEIRLLHKDLHKIMRHCKELASLTVNAVKEWRAYDTLLGEN